MSGRLIESASAVLPEMSTGRQSGDFWFFLGDKIFEIYLLNGNFPRENLLGDGNFSANLIWLNGDFSRKKWRFFKNSSDNTGKCL